MTFVMNVNTQTFPYISGHSVVVIYSSSVQQLRSYARCPSDRVSSSTLSTSTAVSMAHPSPFILPCPRLASLSTGGVHLPHVWIRSRANKPSFLVDGYVFALSLQHNNILKCADANNTTSAWPGIMVVPGWCTSTSFFEISVACMRWLFDCLSSSSDSSSTTVPWAPPSTLTLPCPCLASRGRAVPPAHTYVQGQPLQVYLPGMYVLYRYVASWLTRMAAQTAYTRYDIEQQQKYHPPSSPLAVAVVVLKQSQHWEKRYNYNISMTWCGYSDAYSHY